ncbi:MAG TPA: hypothetical protein VKY53_07350, partial [Marinobacter sp.]|nr:hypothetical protein [Marinobacter sp.]
MNEEVRVLAAYVVCGGILFSLLSIFVMITYGFKYVCQVEELVSTRKGSISSVREIWSGGVIGRLVRVSHVFAYLILRNSGLAFFKKRAALLGDPEVLIPNSWQAWCLIPALTMYGTLAVVLIAG